MTIYCSRFVVADLRLHVLEAYWPLSVRIDGDQTTPDGDLWPVRASMGQKLLSVPRFDQVVIGINCGMARMRTVHPLDFARIKRQLSQDLRRDPLKKTKDMAQAELIDHLVLECLPHLNKLPA